MTERADNVVADSNLWSRVVVAIEAVNRKISERKRDGGWFPTAAVPNLRYFDSGWPHIIFPALADRSAPDYSGIFTLEQNTLAPYKYGDIPELGSLIDYALSRADIVERLRVTQQQGEGLTKIGERIFRNDIAEIALSVAGRAWALDRPDDRDLWRDLYLQRERSLFAEKLEVELIVPLVLTSLELNEAVDLGEGVFIERMSDGLLLACAQEHNTIEAVPSAVANAATHAVVVKGLLVENTPWAIRIWHGYPGLNLSVVDQVIECLRVLDESPTGYAQAFLRPMGWADGWTHDLPATQLVSTYRRYPAVFDDYGWLKKWSTVTAPLLQRLPRMVAAARAADKQTKLAIRRISLAQLREDPDDKLVDACIGIEALLSTDAAEISHKIATRGSVVLALMADPPMKPDVIFKMLKAVYNRRSAVVHGTGSNKYTHFTFGQDERLETHALALWLLRSILRSKLESEPIWSVSTLDDILLKSIRDAAGIAEDSGGADA